MPVEPTLAEMRDVWDSNPRMAHHREAFTGWGEWGDIVDAQCPPGNLGRVVEWGTGGGAVLRVLRPRCNSYVGVDISPRSLEKAKAVADFEPFLLEGNPSTVPDFGADFVISTAVFQHFPTHAYASDVLRVIASWKPRRALIQTRYRSKGQKDGEGSDYAIFRGGLTWDILEFWKELLTVKLDPRSVVIDTSRKYAFYKCGQ